VTFASQTSQCCVLCLQFKIIQLTVYIMYVRWEVLLFLPYTKEEYFIVESILLFIINCLSLGMLDRLKDIN
jgi:hypothetical protein